MGSAWSGQRAGRIEGGERWAPASKMTSVSLRQWAEAEGALQKGSQAGLAEQHAFTQPRGTGHLLSASWESGSVWGARGMVINETPP